MIPKGFASRWEADARPWRRFWRRREKRAQLLVEIARGRIVDEERVINLREPFPHGAVRGELVAHLYKCADHKNAHLRGACTVENIRGLERAVLGECPRTIRFAAVFARTGRKLRPVAST